MRMRTMLGVVTVALFWLGSAVVCGAATAGKEGRAELVVAAGGRTEAVIVVSPEAGVEGRERPFPAVHYGCAHSPRPCARRRSPPARTGARTGAAACAPCPGRR